MRVSLAISQGDVERIAVALSELGALQVAEPTDGASDERWEELTGRLEDQLDRLQQLVQTLGIEAQAESPPPEPDVAPTGDIERIEQRLSKAEEQLAHWRQEHREVDRRSALLEQLLADVDHIRAVGLTVEALLETRLLHPWIGWIPRDQRDRLALPRLQTPLVIVHAMERDDQVLVFAASDAEHGFVLERIMRSVFGRRLSLLDHLGEEAEALQRGHEELAQLARRRDELARKRRQLAEQWRDSLEALLATVRRDLSAARIAAGLRRRGAAWFLAGDIPEDGFERLVTAVQGAADGPHAIFAAGDR